MIVGEGRCLREADHVQHGCDGASSWGEDCACNEHKRMAEGRSCEAGSERFQPGGHQLGPRLDGHGRDLPQSPAGSFRGRHVRNESGGDPRALSRLREISTRHQSEAVGFVPGSALLEQARRIGLAVGKMLVAESMDELTLAFDLSLYTAPPGRSRGIDRYARSAGVVPGIG